MTAIWGFVTAIIPLLLLLFNEFFSAQARARAANEKFVIDQAALKKIVDEAVNKWNSQNAKDSGGAGNAWDNADSDGINPSQKKKLP